jgi:pilus assembly protein CpaB
MKQRMVLIISVLIGLLAFWLTREYFQSRLAAIEKERDRIMSSVRQTDVLAAGRDLPAGTLILMKDLKAKPSFERDISKDTILPADVDQIVGKKLKMSLSKGDSMLWSYVDVPYRPGSGLAPMISPKMRAISMGISGAAAVSGLIRPNDRVDVLGSFMLPVKSNPQQLEAVTLTVLQDVTVIAVGQTLGKAGEGGRPSAGYSTVTFEVTPREAELLAFTENMKGRLTLTLRNPGDPDYVTTLPSVNFERLERELPELNRNRQEVIRHKGAQP